MRVEPKADPQYVGLGKVIALIAVIGAGALVILKAFLYNVLELKVPAWADPLVTGILLAFSFVAARGVVRRVWPSDTARLALRRRSRGW